MIDCVKCMHSMEECECQSYRNFNVVRSLHTEFSPKHGKYEVCTDTANHALLNKIIIEH